MKRLIVIEGLDGSGKSTQTEILKSYLEEKGIQLRQIKLPDYESPSSSLVRMYLAGDFGTRPDSVNAYAASSFYAVDRFANFSTVWKEDYENGTLILADRYATSNATHQMTKLPKEKWDEYLLWLEDFEYCKMGIPKPSLVVFLDMSVEISQRLMTSRYGGDEKKKDVHEADVSYLVACREAGLYAAEKLGWHIIKCYEGDEPRSIDSISAEIRDLADAKLLDREFHMFDLKIPSLSDIDAVKAALAGSGRRGSEACFGNLFMWCESYDCMIAIIDETLVCRAGDSYTLPVGKNFESVFEELVENSKENNEKLKLHCLSEEQKAFIETHYPGLFEFKENRDSADYIYRVENLAELSGKKYHSKRNHISFFEKNFDWSYEDLTKDNADECLEFTDYWMKTNGDKSETGIDNEFVAIKKALSNFEALGFTGGILRVENSIVAYTFGEPISENLFCTHVEKAISDIRGAYPMINREFARNTIMGYEFVNREEDIGIPGLRKAKMSYHPDILLTKYNAISTWFDEV